MVVAGLTTERGQQGERGTRGDGGRSRKKSGGIANQDSRGTPRQEMGERKRSDKETRMPRGNREADEERRNKGGGMV